MRFSIVALQTAALAGLASAQCKQQPTGALSGNPIGAPGLAEQVQAGTPFTITWQPTTPGSVSIVLLRGPSTNVQPIGCIVDSVPNSGEFVWTPSTTLEPDVTRYGIQIIVDGTGQYQYSTQFGISNPSFNTATSRSTTTTQHTNTATREHTETATGVAPLSTLPAVVSQISDGQVQIPTGNATISTPVQAPTGNATVYTATSPIIVETLVINATAKGSSAPLPTVASTGALESDLTYLRGTKTMTVPKTLQSQAQSGRNSTKTNVVVASATGPVSSSPATTSPITSAPVAQPSSGATHFAAAGGLLAGLGALAALAL